MIICTLANHFGVLAVTRKEKTVTKSALPDLETSLSDINTLIEQMEQGELSLEQSLERFERGIHLIKHAQKILQEAEHKVQILIQNNNQADLQPYENDDV
jgi:exodeoxyribonuclease VII small subunit